MKVVNNNADKMQNLKAPATACALWSQDTGCGANKDSSCWLGSKDSCGSTGDMTGCAFWSTDTTALDTTL